MTTYSQQQREYWHKRPANIIKYMTVEFYHPDFGYIRLVANQFNDKQFLVDGTNETFQAVSMEIPQVTNQTTDTTQASSLVFGRIGIEVRSKLLQITPLGAIKNPIDVVIRQYEQIDNQAPTNIYERKLYVNSDGITIGIDSVTVQLSVDNPAKLTNQFAFYDPQVWPGLNFV